MVNTRNLILVLVIVLGGFMGVTAAQQTTIITMTGPTYLGDFFEETLLPQFEADHPGVEVQFVYDDQGDAYNLGLPSLDEEELDAYFERAQAYASLADVLFVPSWVLNPVLTRARYLLDLTPLVATDASLNPDDFYPAAWESAQWDGGIWVLPASARVEMLMYNKDAFDAAGLAYPNDNWSLTDLLNAADALTVFDASGGVEQLGISGFSPALLIQSLTGETFQDEAVIPVPPDFSSPELIRLYQEWLDYDNSHQFSGGGYMMGDIPMSISEPFMLREGIMGIEGTWEASLLPGGHAGVQIDGFAVSAGTAYPELAYELAKFLTFSPEYVNYYGGGTPARRSLIGIEPEGDSFFMPAYPPEAQALITGGFENALPSSDLLFGNFVWAANQYVTEDGMDLAAAFQQLEEEIATMLDAADRRAETTSIVVDIPVPVTLRDGEIILNFGLNNNMAGLSPTTNYWELVIEEFVAAHSRVGDVRIDTQMYGPEGIDPDIDCFYASYNQLSNDEEQLSEYLPLDPLMNADPGFDRNRFIAQVLEQVQRNNMTYGYPIDIQPEILVYNAARFAEAGVLEPADGWDINAFHQALMALKSTQEDPDDPVFSTAQSFGNTYLLMLIAAYGGLPYDYRTDPPTLNLTEPETIEATRQVAQLVRDDLIDYQALVTFGGGFGMGGDIPLMAASLSQGNFLLSQRDEIEEFNQYRATSYPAGNRYVPLSYSIGAAYIRSTAQDIEACYDWISTLADHPELFDGIPADQARIDSPSFAAAKGPDGVAVAHNFLDAVNLPNALVLPGSMGGFISENEGTWLEPYILNKSFDDIMLDQVDVEVAFAEAQSDLETFRDCTAGIPRRDPGEMDADAAMRAYVRQFVDCAVTLVPDLRQQFSFFYEEP